ncbi:hypothetical protein HPB50_018143 [Hyalomma asiaticum]|uniref:Uncharacterized protein n=1 Tax=Hyalomma asiaticum TaxID=266040 RepID=A0ACB7RX74_HYAAI|nr:hypothetical protein HPB50_018143 [Hyalomma asiaticum]
MEGQLTSAKVEQKIRQPIHKMTMNGVVETTRERLDAALYADKSNRAVATVVDRNLREIGSASIPCTSMTEAEETAIALAIANGNSRRLSLNILTDGGLQEFPAWEGRPYVSPPPIRHSIIGTPRDMGLEFREP